MIEVIFPYETFVQFKSFGQGIKCRNWYWMTNTVQSRFSDIKFMDNLWFSDFFSKTIFQFTTWNHSI